MPSKVNIDINYKELEKILGFDPNNPDSETTLNIRHMMVQTFTDKYLKGLAKDETINKARSQILEEITKQIKREIGEQKYNYTKRQYETTFNEQFRKEVNEYVRNERDNLIRTAVTQEFSEVREDLKAKLDSAIEDINKKVDSWMEKREQEVKELTDKYFEEEVLKTIENRAQELFKKYVEKVNSNSLKEVLDGE